jgi:hypothetical protein
MPTTVQFRRGTTVQNDAFTGSVGELSIDTTLDELRVHDGVVAGGVATARKSELTKMMSVANTQTLHTSVTANLNSYVANTNPRITNVLSSIGSTNTAIRSLVSTESSRVGLVNTNLTGTNTAIRTLVSDRVQVANNNTLLGAKATWDALTATNTSVRTAATGDAMAMSIVFG